MEKQRNTELNFLYTDEKYEENRKTTKAKSQKKSKVRRKSNRAGENESAQYEDLRFNFDNEIVIGVTKIPDKNKNATKNSKKTNNSNKKMQREKNSERLKDINEQNNRSSKNNETNNRKTKISNNIKNPKKISKKNRIVKGIVKGGFLLSALVVAIIFFMMSPIFNLSEVQVIDNNKISTDTIISLSQVTIGENIYKTSSKKIGENIKQNAYIESVKIKRQLPNKLIITVKERKATYMLEYANSYAYINNQGYILEISEEKIEVPIIEGYTTGQEEIKVGSRINSEDLEKLAVVLKIVESANGNEIGNLITRINIQDKQNYTIILENEKKTVYLGDTSNLSNRMLYLKAVLEEEKGIEGEIFINGDLNKTDVYFRRKE